jgi:hypothetical protein
MFARKKAILLSGLLALAVAVIARAEFAGVSGVNDIVGPGGDPAAISKSLAHGFPLWVEDNDGNKMAPGLDFSAIVSVPPAMDIGERATLTSVNAFNTAEALTLNPALPVSFNGGRFPNNFPEIFPYYSLVAELAGDFGGPPDPLDPLAQGLILVDHSVVGSFIFEVPVDGEQFMMATTFIRLRNLPQVPGYTLTTPYGSYTFDVVAGGTDVRIDQSIPAEVVVAPALPPDGDFLSFLGPPGPPVAIRDLILNPVDQAGTNINAFLAWRPEEIAAYNTAFQNAFPITGAPPTPGVNAALNPALDLIFRPVLDALGAEVAVEARQRYIAIPQLEAPDIPPPGFRAVAEQPIFQGGNPVAVTLAAPVPIDTGNVDGNGNPNDIVITVFSLQGKIFNVGQNADPVAVADVGNVAGGASSLVVNADGTPLDVTLNDTDPISNNNVHGIHPQAVAAMAFNAARIGTAVAFADLPTAANGNLLVAERVATEQGGTVQRSIDTLTGRARFLYSPPPADPVTGQPFTGQDRFLYVVQDTGGLLSTAAAVTLTVEDLAVNVAYRPRTGRWTISGTTSELEVPDPLNPGQAIANTLAIFGGFSIAAGATPLATATVQADGSWKFEGKLTVSPDVPISCRSANGVPVANIAASLK